MAKSKYKPISKLERELHQLYRAFERSKKATMKEADRSRAYAIRRTRQEDAGAAVMSLLHASFQEGQTEGFDVILGDLRVILNNEEQRNRAKK